jgi:elastase-2
MKTVLLLCLALAVSAGQEVGSKIIGGENANIANHNYQASLRLNGQHNCGAVMLSSTRALSAAHCAASAPNQYSILAGTSDHAVQTCATCALRNPLSQIVRHPGFANNPAAGYPNDIAVLWFNSIATNANIGFIGLATEADGNFTMASCVITGWGLTSTDSTQLPNSLQRAAITVISNNECAAVWGTARIRDEHICAQSPGVTACVGDAGGPMVCDSLLAGVFSWGEAYCADQFPAVYIRISHHRDWILDNSR